MTTATILQKHIRDMQLAFLGHLAVILFAAWLPILASGADLKSDIRACPDSDYFLLTRVGTDALYFSNPPGVQLDESPLKELARRLRASRSAFRYIYFERAGTEENVSVLDVSSMLTYGVSNRSLAKLRQDTYLRSEMDRETLLGLGGLIVDAGCGEKGEAVVAMRAEGIRNVVGIDISARPSRSNQRYLHREDSEKDFICDRFR